MGINVKINYNIELPEAVNNILEQDFWLCTGIGNSVLASIDKPIKFSASVSIFVRRGSAKVAIDIIDQHIDAPCIVNIHKGQILQYKSATDDLEAAFIVVSENFINRLRSELSGTDLYPDTLFPRLMPLSEKLAYDMEELCLRLHNISRDIDNPYAIQGVLHTLLAFVFTSKIHKVQRIKHYSQLTHTTNEFLQLVKRNFRKEKFLKFYADQLGITTQHLSRSVKQQTGISAAEWIERYVLLEAKVLLSSTNLTIQQISDDLAFPSQSFFGKYFKKKVGKSPKDFRNSRG